MEVIKCRNDTLSLLIMFHLMFIKLGIMLGFSAYAHSSPSGAFFPFYRGENGVIKKQMILPEVMQKVAKLEFKNLCF